MNTEKLEKLKKSLDNKFIPDNVKDKIRNEIEKLESEIKSEDITPTELKKEVAKVEEKVEVAIDKAESTAPKKRRGRPAKAKVTPVEPKATETAIKKTAMVVAKTIRKDGEKWNDAMKRANGVMKKEKVEVKKTTKSELDRLLARVRKNKSLMSELDGVKDLRRDAMRTAKPVGKRMSESGNVYYEYRANKTDRKTYGKYAFAGGGALPKYKLGDEVYSYQNKDFKAKVSFVEKRNYGNYDKFAYKLSLPTDEEGKIDKKGTYRKSSNWIDENSLSKTKVKFELGGSVVTDLAGHTGGLFGTGNQGMLDGFSNTAYTGLVGETGAMSSGEMFMSGGGVSKDLFQDYKKQPKKLAEIVDFYMEKFNEGNYDYEDSQRFLKEVESVGYTFDYGLDNEPYGLRLKGTKLDEYELGGGLPAGAEQSYVNYYLGEGASQGIYKDGGAIMNQYEGKTPEEVWNMWEIRQKDHFLKDHFLSNTDYKPKDIEQLRQTKYIKFKELPSMVKSELERHIFMGQYAKGGEIEFKHSNLRIVGTGMDTNGNRIVKVSFPNQKAFSIQSNGTLPETHRLLRNYDEENTNFSFKEIELMEDEITDYVENYGSANQKKSLKIYGSMLDKNNYAKGGGVRKVGNREYSYGRNWTNDHRHVNQAEEHEVTYNRKGKFLGVFAGGGGVENTKIKDWYIKNYPTDDLGQEINKNVTFEDIYITLKEKKDVYKKIGVGDSLVRERLFEHLSEIKKVNYRDIYNMWLDADYYAKGGGVEIKHYKVNGKTFINYMDAVDYCDMNNLSYNKIEKTSEYAKGGGVRQVGNREYSLGRNWTNDHRHTNKSENHEVNYNRKRFFMAGGINEDTPKIYVADLEAYNNGRLVGEWLDLTDYNDADELQDAIQEVLKKSGGEEYAIHDYENIPRSMYSEYMGARDFAELYEMMDLAKENDLPLDVAMEIVSQFDRSALDEFTGVYDSEQDFAEQLVDDIGIQSFIDFQYYLEISETDRRLMSQEMADGYVDDIRDEDGGNRLIEEAGLDVDEYEEADSDRQEEMLDEAREIVYDEYYNNYFEGLSDPYYFLVEEQGLYDAESFANANFVRVDYEKLADALEDDYTFVRHDGQIYVFNIR